MQPRGTTPTMAAPREVAPGADLSESSNLAERNPDVVERRSERLLAWRKTLPEGPKNAGAGKNDDPWPASKDSK